MLRYKILQLPQEHPNKFNSYRYSMEFKLDDYNQVFAGTYEDANANLKTHCEVCEDLYKEFNVNHPAGFSGHSMSVSDVVIIIDDLNEEHAYYCDWCGFTSVM